MKIYDYEKAKEIINHRKDEIERASLGMYEDWFWTAETVFEDGKFTKKLTEETVIGGINGSCWATPALRLELKNGEDECIGCYTGESDCERNPDFSYGCLSGPVQDNMPELK